MKTMKITLNLKEPDDFSELRQALPERTPYLDCGEYATVELTVEVVRGKPSILAGRFLKVR